MNATPRNLACLTMRKLKNPTPYRPCHGELGRKNYLSRVGTSPLQGRGYPSGVRGGRAAGRASRAGKSGACDRKPLAREPGTGARAGRTGQGLPWERQEWSPSIV
jgi:hypothetical protein